VTGWHSIDKRTLKYASVYTLFILHTVACNTKISASQNSMLERVKMSNVTGFQYLLWIFEVCFWFTCRLSYSILC